VTASRCCPVVPAPQPQPRKPAPDDLAAELNPHETELNPHEAVPSASRQSRSEATVVSSTLQGPFDWPDATVANGDAVEIVRRMKEESDVPVRSHGSLSLNRALMAAGLVDRIQVTVFPVIAAQTEEEPVFAGAGDFDLDLLETRTLDGRTQELVYRPTLRTWPAS
jgi:dihydrofolate reductase